MEGFMLDQNHRHAKNLIFSRNELLRYLLGLEAIECERILIKKGSAKAPDRYVFVVKSEPCCDEVRRQFAGLTRLREALEELQVDFRKNKGLWVPQIADPENGDCQVNVSASCAWNTKAVTVPEILDYARDDEREAVLAQMKKLSCPSVKLCREAGKAYRVAVRNDMDGRRVSSLHEFAVVLGDNIPLNLPANRVRAKRSDAWRGVEEPLFFFKGIRDRVWLVYPDIQSES
jgi:hypothetical protein